MPEGGDERVLAAGPGPLTARERWFVLVAGLAPLVLAGGVVVAVGAVLGAGAGEMLGATVVYGGLLGLAGAFVAVDRLHARQCPRCRTRAPRGTRHCSGCGYDLVERPRYACDEGHAIHLVEGDGMCRCGRRLRRLPAARGIAREVVFMVKLGGWLLAVLIGIAVVLRLIERVL